MADSAAMTSEMAQTLSIMAGRIFTPTSPIEEKSLFAGRRPQIERVIDAVNQKGQHAIIFGERGVGKTSLAKVLSSFLAGVPNINILAARINCDTADNFDSVWRKVFAELQLQSVAQVSGFTSENSGDVKRKLELIEVLDDTLSPDTIRRQLRILSQNALPILIIDEFDRLDDQAKAPFADTIKSLSDDAVNATVVLVGVADTIDQLISQHQSVGRALVQIKMPRMSAEEVNEIINTGLARLTMSIEDAALTRIALLSQGLPHYAHLLGLNASRVALQQRTLNINTDLIFAAIQKALDGAHHSIQNAWHNAILSARKDNLFSDVLLACALAKTNEQGTFAAQDVRGPLCEITGKHYDIPNFAQHLSEFSDAKRGPVLQRLGVPRRFRFRFTDPLMQPYVIMQGFTQKKINKTTLDRSTRL